MNRSIRMALGTATAVALAVGTAVVAQASEWGHGHGPGNHAGNENCHGDTSARLDALKSELNLTTAQEPAWQAYETAIKAQTEKMLAERQTTESKDPMQARIDLMEVRLAGMKEIQKARQDLLQVLTDEQKAILNKHSPTDHHKMRQS